MESVSKTMPEEINGDDQNAIGNVNVNADLGSESGSEDSFEVISNKSDEGRYSERDYSSSDEEISEGDKMPDNFDDSDKKSSTTDSESEDSEKCSCDNEELVNELKVQNNKLQQELYELRKRHEQFRKWTAQNIVQQDQTELVCLLIQEISVLREKLEDRLTDDEE